MKILLFIKFNLLKNQLFIPLQIDYYFPFKILFTKSIINISNLRIKR
jgi:hypothetical protein